MKFIATLLFLFSCIFTSAQVDVIVTGKAIEAKTGRPVAGASIYINNSTIGTITNNEGLFILYNVPPQKLDLVCSSVQFETVIIQLTSENMGQPILFKMREKVIELESVIVRVPQKDGWKKYWAQFLKSVLGYSKFSAECKLLNNKAVKFRYDVKENILYAWASEPLKIKNNALGYELNYWLSDFRINYSSGVTFLKGTTQFVQQKGSKKEKAEWNENRAQSYAGSFNHFIKSLYNSTTMQDGFVINRIKYINIADTVYYIPVDTATIAYNNIPLIAKYISDIFKGQPGFVDKVKLAKKVFDVATELKSWMQNNATQDLMALSVKDLIGYSKYIFVKDSIRERFSVSRFFVKDSVDLEKVQFFGNFPLLTYESSNTFDRIRRATEYKNHEVVLLYTVSVDPQEFVFEKNNDKMLFFSDYWKVKYTNEKEEKEYSDNLIPKEYPAMSQVSGITLPNEVAINILPNGNYFESFDILLSGYWAFEKLDKLLPLDYILKK